MFLPGPEGPQTVTGTAKKIGQNGRFSAILTEKSISSENARMKTDFSKIDPKKGPILARKGRGKAHPGQNLAQKWAKIPILTKIPKKLR